MEPFSIIYIYIHVAKIIYTISFKNKNSSILMRSR